MSIEQVQISALELAFAATIMDQFGLADLNHPMPVCQALQSARILVELTRLNEESLLVATSQTLADLTGVLPSEAQFLESLFGDKGTIRQPDH